MTKFEKLLNHIADIKDIPDSTKKSYKLGYAIGFVETLCILYPEINPLIDQYAKSYNYKED